MGDDCLGGCSGAGKFSKFFRFRLAFPFPIGLYYKCKENKGTAGNLTDLNPKGKRIMELTAKDFTARLAEKGYTPTMYLDVDNGEQ